MSFIRKHPYLSIGLGSAVFAAGGGVAVFYYLPTVIPTTLTTLGLSSATAAITSVKATAIGVGATAIGGLTAGMSGVIKKCCCTPKPIPKSNSYIIDIGLVPVAFEPHIDTPHSIRIDDFSEQVIATPTSLRRDFAKIDEQKAALPQRLPVGNSNSSIPGFVLSEKKSDPDSTSTMLSVMQLESVIASPLKQLDSQSSTISAGSIIDSFISEVEKEMKAEEEKPEKTEKGIVYFIPTDSPKGASTITLTEASTGPVNRSLNL